VRAEIAPRGVIHDALEQAAENGGRDQAPIQPAQHPAGFAHGGVEPGGRQRFGEQLAVDVGKGGELLVEVGEALVGGVLRTWNSVARRSARSLPSSAVRCSR
jgi:hypothetical protein